MKLKMYQRILLALSGGSLYALGFPSVFTESLFISTFLGFIFIIISILDNLKISQKVILILFFSLSFNLTGFYWIGHTLMEFGNVPYLVSKLLSLLFSLFIAPQLYLFLIVIILEKKILGNNKITLNSFRALYLSIIFTFIEHYAPMQFPTNIGQIWMIFGEYINFSSIGGLPFYSFITYFISLKLIALIKNQEKILLSSITIILSVLIAFFPIGKNTNELLDTLNVRIVQANIGNFLKLESENGDQQSINEVIARYVNLSLRPSEFDLDLIIWPETAYPFSLKSYDKLDIPVAFQNIINQKKADLIIGGYDRPDTNSNPFDYFMTEYNSVFHFNQNLEIKETYHKIQLLPFGETLPLGNSLNQKISDLIPSISFFGRGEKQNAFKIKNDISFVTPICYEILDSHFMRKFINQNQRVHFILNVTNDSWYGDTAEPRQHLFLSKWRALELNLPIIRSTNTGITSIIYPDSTESKRLLVGEKDTLDIKLPIYQTYPTLFQIYGILANFIIWLPFLLLEFYLNKKIKI